MRRRELIIVIGGMAVAVPFAVRAQQPTGVRRLGVLLNLSEDDLEAQRLVTAFRERLAQLGWADGRNLRIDYRWSGGDVSRVRAFAKELVELSPDIIVVHPASCHLNASSYTAVEVLDAALPRDRRTGYCGRRNNQI